MRDEREHMHKYDFDSSVDRTGTDCIKWDYLKEFFGKDDLDAFWVADMDFKAPDEILKPIRDRAAHGVFGYTAKPPEFYSAVIEWFQKRYQWKIQKEWIVTTPGVVPALNLAVQEFTEPGDGIIIQPPVYFPFMHAVELNGRTLLDNTLQLRDGIYRMDFEDLERKASKASMLILCSPHNPVARVWSESELDELGRICREHDLFVFSDEIHADIVFNPHRHLPTPAVNSDLARRTISAFATSKTFNLAGLQLSINIIPDQEIRERFKKTIEKLHLNMSNIFGIVGTRAAYENGEPWLDQLLEYLWGNFTAVRDHFESEIPKITVLEPEGTFLLWLDCRKLELSDKQLASLFVHRAGLALSAGEMFGQGGSGFMRLNIACPRINLINAARKLKTALEDDSPLPEVQCCDDAPDDT